jgi:C-terminal processing protease CtpA/Prc
MLRRILAAISIVVVIPSASPAQTPEVPLLPDPRRYLADLHADLKRSFYDRNLLGLNVDSMRAVADKEIANAQSDQERYRAIDRFLAPFNDSHTFFVAPRRIGLRDYHFRIRFIAEKPYVVGVDMGSLADSAGVRLGDEVLSFDGNPITRRTFHRVTSEFLGSHPIRPLKLKLKDRYNAHADVTVPIDTAEIYRTTGARFRKMLAMYRDSSELATSHLQASVADSIFVWRLPQFAHADKGIGKVVDRARKHRIVILDLRGNPGGSIKTLANLVGYFVDHEVLVGDLHTRIGTEKFVAKPKKNRFEGRLMILVDSETASAAEVFARLMQIEQRAVVYGDQTAGAVMASNFFQYYEDAGASITISDFVLHNGERLEHVGVKPDVPLIMTAAHVASQTDPILSFALLKAGARVAPAIAVNIFAGQ